MARGKKFWKGANKRARARGMAVTDMAMGAARRQGDVEEPLLVNGGCPLASGPGYNHELLHSRPDETLRWIETFGVRQLGSFTVRDSTVLRLLERSGMLTKGMPTRELDWEAMWRTELAKDDTADADERSAQMEVEAWVVDIEHAAGADDAGLLNPLLHCFQRHVFNVNVWALPAVEAVITFKWQQWAQRALHIELGLYLIWLLSFQAFILLFQDEDTSLSLQQLLQVPKGAASVAVECLALLGMAPFLYIEGCTLFEYGPSGWLDFWNVLDVTAYSAQIAITVCHLGRLGLASNALSVLMAIQVLVLYVKLQYFARVLQPSKNPFVDTIAAVITDTRWFFGLLLLTMFGFSMAFYILFRKDQQKEEFASIGAVFSAAFAWLIGGVDLGMFKGTHNPMLGLCLLLLYWFAMSMVLLNCLIAIMADACARVNQNQDARFLCGRAAIIDELEESIPGWVAARCEEQWHPRYVHYLTVNRCSVDPAITEAAEKADEVTQRLSALETQVAQMIAIQEAMAKHVLGHEAYRKLLAQRTLEEG